MRSHIGIRYWELQEINYNIPYPEVVCHKNCGITDTEAASMLNAIGLQNPLRHHGRGSVCDRNKSYPCQRAGLWYTHE